MWMVIGGVVIFVLGMVVGACWMLFTDEHDRMADQALISSLAAQVLDLSERQ